MEKRYICKAGWVRHSKGTIITHWEWKKLPPDVQFHNFEEYTVEPSKSVEEEAVIVPEPVQTFEKDLAQNLEKAGIKAEFKHKVKNGKPELDATFKFDENE